MLPSGGSNEEAFKFYQLVVLFVFLFAFVFVLPTPHEDPTGSQDILLLGKTNSSCDKVVDNMNYYR